ncbi:glutamine--fructose-6-phosphate transaminase (isomerizing) [Subtercola sp. PAMC28395]|uniref:glutamine--fructose-6-phosphate transaminase (isomerizing) n=1 Tax=Subtercola sp. PAMC28395 TaxID=2846775 RepID=UPI001C0E261B|nr:glutamine--fructose-6-phosphate transaminase (isomerizing) [Subtercola sp. PAMC28395]QWT23390.1 glutamine--fructose-6-phosphate transaminase (isomerizing) [Subtercola sp. PAMC28395]
MCGIVGCSTPANAASYLLPALQSLEYRGYDSVGVAIRTTGGDVATLRSIDRIDDLTARVDAWAGLTLGGVGIGHTRWATHGDVTEANAHPHRDCAGLISVVHNGIIENSDALRSELVAGGHEFASGVDSEVVCHLIEYRLVLGDDIQTAICSATARLTGSWALVVMETSTGRLFAATHRAPLLVANSDHGVFVASDITAIAPWVSQFRVMADDDLVELTSPPSWSRKGVRVALPEPVSLSWSNTIQALTADDEDFMGREIAEQPETVARILDELADRVSDGSLWKDFDLPRFDRVAVVGCGTSLNAGRIIASAFGSFAHLPHTSIIASEASGVVLDQRTLMIATSQSGETADVLRALDDLQGSGCPVLALTNNSHSTLARRADGVVNCFAGPEIGVAATKTFVAQIVTGVCVALSSMVANGQIPGTQAQAIIDDMARLPDRLERAISVSNALVPELIAQLVAADGFLFLGRGAGVIYAAEGALKLKELTYRWAEHYPAGELKHGPLALVDTGTPVVVIDNGDPRLAGNIAEVHARGGRIIRIGGPGTSVPVVAAGPVDLLQTDGASSFAPHTFAPCGPLESVVPLQILARDLAIALGRDVDKPRNLAKSVTVE